MKPNHIYNVGFNTMLFLFADVSVLNSWQRDQFPITLIPFLALLPYTLPFLMHPLFSHMLSAKNTLEVMLFPFFCQVESGFFHESDAKTVGKSIRDRVALIKWRRGRTVSAAVAVDQGEGGHRVQMTPSQGISAGVAHVGQPPMLEPEEQDADTHNRLCNLPASATSVTCKRFCSPPLKTQIQSLTFLWVHDLRLSAADSTLDSGMGSTVYSDSHSSQQSVLYQSLLEPITMATQQVCIKSTHPGGQCMIRYSLI